MKFYEVLYKVTGGKDLEKYTFTILIEAENAKHAFMKFLGRARRDSKRLKRTVIDIKEWA